MTLTLRCMVRTEERVRSFVDHRFIVTRIVAEYDGTAGEYYRKSFEARNGLPTVPKTGTHDSLNEMRKQW